MLPVLRVILLDVVIPPLYTVRKTVILFKAARAMGSAVYDVSCGTACLQMPLLSFLLLLFPVTGLM